MGPLSISDGTAFRTCPLCEAGCGLAVEVAGGRVTRIRGDVDDVFSHGYLCAKGTTLGRLHDDPDRLRTPMVKRGGVFEVATWDEAYDRIAEGMAAVRDRHGPEAVAIYLGNPNAHSLAAQLYLRPLAFALGSRLLFSASTLDQRPREVATTLLYGNVFGPVPDLDRCEHLVIIGANPVASNGSLATAPDWPGRIDALRERGGKVVVIDPRRTETAAHADEHHFVRPETDALLLAAMLHVLLRDGRVTLGAAEGLVEGLDQLEGLVAPFGPDAVADACGIDAATIVQLTRELAAAPRAALYGRLGTTTQRFGTLTSWLIEVLNILSGNLDRPGGVMFSSPATGRMGRGALRRGRWHSRVRDLPEVAGELPSASLAEEIDTPGEGQLRALLTIAGNPARSAPNSERVEAALAGLEFMVSVDIYLNETTRHADVILPVPSPLQRSHYDLALLQLAVRNVANYSEPVLPLGDGELDEWEVLARLAAALGGDPLGPASGVDEMVARELASRIARRTGGDADDLLAAVDGRVGPERLLDLMLRGGPAGLTLDDLLAHPHGIDLGPLEPSLPEVLATESGRIELVPELIEDELERLRATIGGPRPALVLIGRRHVRSNNSWMHNIEVLVKGRDRCTLQVHPQDATTAQVLDGDRAVLASEVGAVEVVVEVTADVMPGVVSLPHGWGNGGEGTRLTVASARPGSNINAVTDDAVLDEPSGTSAFSGVPVSLRALP